MRALGELLKAVDGEYAIKTAQELVRIPSENPPGREKDVAEYILRELKRLKFDDIKISEAEPDRPNIIAKLHGRLGTRTLLLNGHMDVVPAGSGWTVPPYGGVIRDGRLWGRGACDMKGGLAAILAVAKAYRDAALQPEGNILFTFVVDEEMGGKKGTGFLADRGLLKADMAIVAEPSNFRLSVSEGGVVWIKLIIHGKQAHTINAKAAINPIEKASKVIQELQRLNEKLQKFRHPKFGSPVLSVNVIRGGDKINLVPAQCVLQADLRLPPGIGISVKEAQAYIEQSLKELTIQDPLLRMEMEFSVVAYPFEQPEDTQIVDLLKSATKAVLGHEAEWWHRGTGAILPKEDSDVFHLWTKCRIPSVYFGPGEVELAHAVDESIRIEEIVQAAKIFTLTAFMAVGG